MKKYRSNADSPVRTDYGIGLVAGLGFFVETKGYAASFNSLNDELNEAYVARRAARKPLVEKRARFRFAHYNVDQTIRMAYRAAEVADGGRRGPLTEALFEDGLGPVVAPYGTRQIQPTSDLIDRIARSKLPNAEAYRNEWKPKLEAALASLVEAANDVKAARDAYLDAYRAEVALRAEHYYTVDKIMGLVRAAFPGDRARQDLVFPAVEDSSDAAEGEGEGEDVGDGGEAGGSGAGEASAGAKPGGSGDPK